MCSACFPRLSLLTDASLSSTGSSRASSPASSVLSKRYDALPPSRRTSFPSLGGTSAFTRSFRSPVDECTAEAWSWSPGISAREYCRGNDRISQVPGEPQLSVCTCSHPTPAGLLAPDHHGAATWPLVCEKQRLPRKVFRRSIAWLSDWLSTLRSTGYSMCEPPSSGQTERPGQYAWPRPPI